MKTETMTKTRAKTPLDHVPASGIEAHLMRAVVNAKAFFAGEETKAKRTRVPLATARSATAKRAPDFHPSRVRRLRAQLQLSQSLFAAALNASTGTVQGWEQGTKKPSGPAARLLELAERHPEVIKEQITAR